MQFSPENRILECAKESFFRLGIRSVSMDDIASNLAMSKKTIYKYFKDKNTLVDAVTKGMVNLAQCNCSSRCEKAENAVDELLKLMVFVSTVFSNMNPAVLHDLRKYFPESYVHFQKHQQVFVYESVTTNLLRGIKEGLFREEIDVELLARIRMGQINMSFDPEFFPPDKFELKKVQLASLELFLMGITTEKGREVIKAYKTQNEL